MIEFCFAQSCQGRKEELLREKKSILLKFLSFRPTGEIFKIPNMPPRSTLSLRSGVFGMKNELEYIILAV